ncbi:MAG: c-type cytochrome biogenesis protein CcmI [Abyssibacter sp.]|uniref:c-type cytochrome biogenesis protein CcmI n=1 Tax=Abyssibacter sp. TaxID=2320200 RepID=UPI00321A8DA1
MKTTLIVAFVLSTLVAMLFPALALRRPGAGRRSRQQDNVEAFRSRKAELEADLAAGRLTQTDYEQLEADAAAELLQDAQAEEGTARPGGRWMALVAIGVVPVVAVGLYVAGGGLPPTSHAEQMQGLVAQLEQRVQAVPEDQEARRMLARVYMGSERYQQAAQLYRQINEQTGSEDASALVAEGEALGMARGQDWLGRPAALFDAALALEPNNIRALWYGSLAAAQGGETNKALLRLQRLDRQPLDDPLRSAVRRAVVAMGGVPADTATTDQPAGQGTQIRVLIEVSDALAAALPDEFALFVFAKQVDGPPMPLAAQRLGTTAFPRVVTLTQDNAMVEGLTLDSADVWEVSARISQAGEARATAGDLQGSIRVERDELDGVQRLVINERVVAPGQ